MSAVTINRKTPLAAAEKSGPESVMDFDAQAKLHQVHGILKLAMNELLSVGEDEPTPDGVAMAVTVAHDLIHAELVRAGAA